MQVVEAAPSRDERRRDGRLGRFLARRLLTLVLTLFAASILV
jgi:hypothetical protein